MQSSKREEMSIFLLCDSSCGSSDEYENVHLTMSSCLLTWEDEFDRNSMCTVKLERKFQKMLSYVLNDDYHYKQKVYWFGFFI